MAKRIANLVYFCSIICRWPRTFAANPAFLRNKYPSRSVPYIYTWQIITSHYPPPPVEVVLVVVGAAVLVVVVVVLVVVVVQKYAPGTHIVVY